MKLASFLTLGALSTLASAVIENKQLRMMPLGASITNGFGSSHGSGYRAMLWKLLDDNNNTMSYIGSKTSGDMLHKHNEGHPGYKTGQMISVSKETVKKRPNVILIMVGSNDCSNEANAQKGGKDMGVLLDSLSKSCPDAAILVSLITTSPKPALAALFSKFNEGVADVVKERAEKGMHVYPVDFSKLLDAKTDFSDERHPNDNGFAKIAWRWHEALGEVAEKGWIGTPVHVEGFQDEHLAAGTSELGGQSRAQRENSTSTPTTPKKEAAKPTGVADLAKTEKEDDDGKDGKDGKDDKKGKRSVHFRLM